ncbi:putative T7SS-secreted protein [Cellulomonas soli]|uniref:Putative T7SS secretion signal domain-containing protein n=1 Tax=Cellulomonas soli TaxID=931535 RepID=A0A512PF88_9CELL|nr:hypothetical protein [Cellulomonas soli]NYI59397.1 hypothetical protein [Cellulomonas soli]GEP69812.1 hypothetical protein CSO01_25270 [Cellulomonas soli]
MSASTFAVAGDPPTVRVRAAQARSTGYSLVGVGDALGRLTADGWSGRAADSFRESAGTEPRRWHDAGQAFIDASAAYYAFADALALTQAEAEAAAADYLRGDQTTRTARATWEAQTRSAQMATDPSLAIARAVIPLQEPFHDPGEAIRDAAETRYETAVAQLDAAAHTCAAAVRAASEAAPRRRNWFESGAAFVGGVLLGAGEAVWGMMTMQPGTPWSLLSSLWRVSTGDLTAEEWRAQWGLTLEGTEGLFAALTTDPVGFGVAFGKSMVDWDTWSDDPARALGHLVPDAALSVLNAGARGASVTDDVADAASATSRLGGYLDDATAAAARRQDYTLADGAQYSTHWAQHQISTERTSQHIIEELLADEDLFRRHSLTPWTRDDLVTIATHRAVGDLSTAERAVLREIADALPPPATGEVVQKVLTVGAAKTMLEASPGTDAATRVSGSVTRIEDSAHLDSVRKLQQSLRLDFDNHSFPPDDVAEYVLRMESPVDTEVSRFSSMGGSGASDGWVDPYTGNGFLKSSDLIPEYRIPLDNKGQGQAMMPGAEMWEIMANGDQRLAAVFDGQQWIKAL